MSAADSFAGYRCWDPSNIHKVLDYEAGRLADAVLLAAHSPATITVGTDPDQRITEQKALERLTTIDEHGIKIVPILGKAGSGKSHLVRWFRPHVERIENAFVVYIPKGGENLRELILGILDTLHEAGHTDESAELRVQLDRAFQRIEEEGMEEAILNRVSEQLAGIARHESDDPERQGIAELLPPLVRDDAFRKPLCAEGGVVERFRSSVEERDEVELEGEGFSFGVSDIPKLAQLEGRLGDNAQRAWDQIESDPRFKELAADLIFETFRLSIPQLFGLAGQVSLEAVFRAARRLLLQEGKDLYVLIEDLSRMQGLESSLLESFLELPTKDGEQQLCNLHVAIASTDGFYNQYTSEGFRVRTEAMNSPDGGSLIHLESIADSGGWDAETLTNFASRYLNALRVGPDALEASYATARNQGSEINLDWVPQACDECRHIDKCHSSFGQTEGRGHYPFNVHSLNSFYIDALHRPHLLRIEGQFNPRVLIEFVLKPILATSPAYLENGTFPPVELNDIYRHAPQLAATVLTDLQANQDDQDNQRRSTMLRYWGGPPEQLEDLAVGIHDAFSISRLGRDKPSAITGQRHVGEDSVRLQWTVPTTVVGGVDLRVSSDGGGTWEQLLTASTVLVYEHEGLAPGQYSYEVSARGPQEDTANPWNVRVSVGTGPEPPKKVNPFVKKIEEWNGRQPIGAGDTTRVTTALYKAVEEATDWHGLGLPPPPATGNNTHLMGRQGQGVILNRFSFHIEDSLGGDRANTTVVREITRDSHGALLIHLAQATAGDAGAIGLGEVGYGALVGFVDDVAEDVADAIRAVIDPEADGELAQAITERLALAGMLGGVHEPELDHIVLAEMAFAEAPGIRSEGAGNWANLVDRLLCDQQRRLDCQRTLADMARTTQANYGDGSTLRAGRVARLLKSLSEEWTPVKEHEGPPRIERLTSRDLNSAVTERLRAFDEAIATIGGLLGPDEVQWSALVEAINEARLKAIQGDFGEALSGLEELLRVLADRPAPEVYQGLTDPSSDTDLSTGERIRALGAVEDLHPTQVAQLLSKLEEFLIRTVDLGRQRLPDGGDSPTDAESPAESLRRAVIDLQDELGQS